MASTVAYLVLFLVLASPLGAFGANAAALGATTVLNTALHAGLRGRRRAATGGGAFAAPPFRQLRAWCSPRPALGVAYILGPTTENDLIALVLATFAATPLRFLAVHAAARSCTSSRHAGLPSEGRPMMTTVLLPPRADAEHPSKPAQGGPGAASQSGRVAARLRRLLRGTPGDPPWVRPGLVLLLAATAIAYTWALSDSGWANSFYAAAVQAGTKSWKAFFFGSSDASNFITVDKPPASLWVMEISARIFGLSSWSLLVPQALEGVAAVAVLYATVRRWFAPGAALLSGAVLALTPVAALMFRFDNPDALWPCCSRPRLRDRPRPRTGGHLVARGRHGPCGTGFITKMLQAFLVLPAIGLVYLRWAPTSLGRRARQLLVAAAALVFSAGWWVVAVQLTPAADRPYIGGSQDNSLGTSSSATTASGGCQAASQEAWAGAGRRCRRGGRRAGTACSSRHSEGRSPGSSPGR